MIDRSQLRVPQTGPDPEDSEATRGSFIVDGREVILGFDREMEELTGWRAVDVVGRHKALVGAPDGLLSADTPGTAGPLYDAKVPVPLSEDSCELRLKCRDGSTIDVEATATRLPGTGDRVAIGIRRLIARWTVPTGTGLLDTVDPLTGLLDGTSFAAKVAIGFRNAAAAGRPVALILADVDHMRRFNDQQGRAIGDEILKKLAGILHAAASEGDLVARLSEDDFALALIGSGRREAREIAGRLRTTVERFRFLGAPAANDPPHITLSLGSASFPADAESASSLMDRALDALGEARSHGRNRVWCYTRRARVPVRTPVYFDGAEPLLLGIARDLSPSGIFVQTPAPLATGMRCALAFPLPGCDGNVHVIGRVVRAIQPRSVEGPSASLAGGMAIEFERFGPEDRTAIEGFLHGSEALDLRTERIDALF